MYLAMQSDAIIANSTVEVAALIDDVGAKPDRIWVIPPGVDAQFFTPLRIIADSMVRGRLGAGAEQPIIAVVGRVQPLKGQELAIRALASVTEGSPMLVIAGEPTPGAEEYFEGLRLLADELGVTASVRFAGAMDRDDLADLLAAASLTLVPSFSETFGLVALESAASGTPVIATEELGRTGAVAPAISGVLVGSRDPEEWAKVITALLSDPTLLAELGETSREYAESFSWASAAAGLLGVYASLAR